MTQHDVKILAVQSTSIFEHYGGIEYYLDDLLTTFALNCGKQSVRTLIPIDSPLNTPPNRSYQVIPIRIPVTKLTRRIENRLAPRRLAKMVQEIHKSRPNIILCGHVSLAPACYLASRLFGIPYFCVVYGIECWGDLYWQDDWSLRHCDQIISISHWTQRILESQGHNAHTVSVIHPIISEDLVNKKRIRTPRKAFTLLTVSRLDPTERYKGHDDVLEALAMIRRQNSSLKIHYIIQGTGQDERRLREKTAALLLDDWVEFIQATPQRKELAELYAKADCFIMPSRFAKIEGSWKGEGFGIVYAEAGALGVPSIAYRCGGATDIIEHGRTGILVAPNNIAELAHSIQYAIGHPEELREMGEQARTRVHSLFTSRQMTAAVSKLLCETLGVAPQAVPTY